MFTVLSFFSLNGFPLVAMLRSHKTLLTVEITFVSPTFTGRKIPDINQVEMTIGAVSCNTKTEFQNPNELTCSHISFGQFHHVKAVKMIPLVFLSLQSLHQKLNVHCRVLLHSQLFLRHQWKTNT